jgi:tetratricopeptide (TPR) repeat protein
MAMVLNGIAYVASRFWETEQMNGSASMQKSDRNNFFFTVFSSKETYFDYQTKITSGGFYQYLYSELIRESSLRDFANKLVAIAEQSLFLRANTSLSRIAGILLNFPLPELYRNIGCYYQALSIRRKGQTEEAKKLFEQVCKDAPPIYHAKALLSLGAISFERREFSSSRAFYFEAGRLASRKESSDIAAHFQAQCAIAALNSVEGDHQGAVTALRGLLPLARIAASRFPSLWFEFHNNLAVELMEAGQFEEARYASNVALSSPIARAYPEWHETARDLEIKTRRRSRSVVALCNVKSLPAKTQPSLPVTKPEARNIISIEKVRPSSIAPEPAQKPERRTAAHIIDFPIRSQQSAGEDIFDDPVYLNKRYEIMVTAVETNDLKLLDELYESLIRRMRPQLPPSKR